MIFVARETKRVIDTFDPATAVFVGIETFEGVFTFVIVRQHFIAASPQRARELLWEYHKSNLRWAWLVGFPGLFPVYSWCIYRLRLRTVRLQEQGRAPREWTPESTGESREVPPRVGIAFILITLAIIGVIYGLGYFDR